MYWRAEMRLKKFCSLVLTCIFASGNLLVSRWHDAYIALEPLDFIARLAALVSKPGVNLTRLHGVFVPN
jgi:hypothetical protein